MPARTTRGEARARVLAAFAAQLDRVIPTDETIPLKGATFADFEDQVETLAQATLPLALAERATLADNAQDAVRTAAPRRYTWKKSRHSQRCSRGTVQRSWRSGVKIERPWGGQSA
ncbi:MAG: hypothetical protein PVJ57_10675 [Phycisphaerae bacterium]|jgi:hypothetical protein